MPRNTIGHLVAVGVAAHAHRRDGDLERDMAAGTCAQAPRRGLLRLVDGDFAEQWYPEHDEASPKAVSHARRLCGGCPSQAACLVHALRAGTVRVGGIRGGTTAAEREAYLRTRRFAARQGVAA